MKEIIKLALRNLKEHKSKTIIISMFILFGVAIVIMGNSFLESVNRGLEKDFRANVTGDIAISTIPEKGTIIDVFGVNSTNFTGEIPQIPAINELDKVENILIATEALGLGAVWTACYPKEDRVEIPQRILNLPEYIVPLCVIPMGYPKSDNSPIEKWNEENIIYNKYSQ